MNSKREMIRFLLAGMGLGAISTLVGSIAFTLYDVVRQAQEWGVGFVKSTLKYNMIIFLECMLYVFPVSLLGAALAYWVWKTRHKISKNQIFQRSLFVGSIGGVVNIFIMLFFDRQLGRPFPDFYQTLSMLLIWVVSSAVWGWAFTGFLRDIRE